MYTQSTTRQFSIALVLVAALAGIVTAGVEADHYSGATPTGAGLVASGDLPVLPEIVVTASRIEVLSSEG